MPNPVEVESKHKEPKANACHDNPIYPMTGTKRGIVNLLSPDGI
jgi:hypothetical protein